MPDRVAVCVEVLSGDTIVVDDGGRATVRYSNVWAPALGTPLGDALLELNRELVLGKQIRYVPNGHMHWDANAIIAEVYLGGLWVNQHLRGWLSVRFGKPEWVNGVPGNDQQDQGTEEQRRRSVY